MGGFHDDRGENLVFLQYLCPSFSETTVLDQMLLQLLAAFIWKRVHRNAEIGHQGLDVHAVAEQVETKFEKLDGKRIAVPVFGLHQRLAHRTENIVESFIVAVYNERPFRNILPADPPVGVGLVTELKHFDACLEIQFLSFFYRCE